VWDLAETTLTFGAQLKESFPRKEKTPDQSLLEAPVTTFQGVQIAVHTDSVSPDFVVEELAQQTMMIGEIKKKVWQAAVEIADSRIWKMAVRQL